jgi:hypothetical protein
LLKTAPEKAEELFAQAEVEAKARMTFLEQLGKIM